MKKILSIAILSVLIACGGMTDAAQQTGTRAITPTPQHGHSGTSDGGILKLTGAMAYLASEVTLTPNATTNINFSAEAYDTQGVHSTITNANRFVVPVGYNYAQLRCHIYLQTENVTGADIVSIMTTKSGDAIIPGMELKAIDGTVISQNTNILAESAIVAVNAGDYLSMQLLHFRLSGDGVVTVFGQENGFGASYCVFNLYR